MKWRLEDEDSNVWMCLYCRNEWTFISGTPIDNEAYYCPKCGTYLKEK